jgi:2,3-bisphosphoglycerate-independent phosphoglycerate mutase
MKYAIILPDGAADEPLAELNNRTVLEAARTPHMDEVARTGRIGSLVTVPQGFLPGSDVATLSVLGCDPQVYYAGRAPLEAVARDIPVGPRDIVFRCNLVTVRDGLMHDFTAGHIDQSDAAAIIAALNAHFAADPVDFFEGVQYRHLMVLRDAGELDCTCTPPHDIPDQPVAKYQPVGTAADAVVALMDRARALLANHPINTARLAANKQPATDIWLWGQGRVKPLETWQERFGLRGASIAAVDLIRGITKLLGCAQIDVPGATGFLDTNYAGKGAAAVQALDDYDVVCVHIEAPDEAGHLGDMSAKIEAIEQVDRHVVGPVLTKLRTFDKWRILIAPDHPTPVSTRTHTSTPPPFCAAGTGINASNASGFSEKVAEADGQPVHPGHELITKFVSAAIM